MLPDNGQGNIEHCTLESSYLNAPYNVVGFNVYTPPSYNSSVIPFIDANFRTSASRNGRAIEGFSMGGRGAIKLAFNYPDQFCSTIAYAGAAYESIPGSASGNPYIGPYEPANQISTITANNAANILANGLQIRLVDGAVGQGGGSPTLSSQLTSLGIDHEFVASQSGVSGHNWAQYHRHHQPLRRQQHLSAVAHVIERHKLVPIQVSEVRRTSLVSFAPCPRLSASHLYST